MSSLRLFFQSALRYNATGRLLCVFPTSFSRQYLSNASSVKNETSHQISESTSESPAVKETSCQNCSDLSRQLENAVKEQREMEERIGDLTDKYKRALAEMENVRHRLMRQAEDARLFAVQSFAKDLLVVADSLSTAAKAVSTASAKVHDDGNFRALYDGLILTDSQLHQVFSKHGLAKIEPAVGDRFDPKLHEALFQQESNGDTSGAISAVQKVGYRLRDRCVRPAIVGVFK